MVTKQQRNNSDRGCYDVNITDKNGNGFKMLMGGNGDLYWVPENHKKCTKFYIDKRDRLLYNGFVKLFKLIEQRDDRYNPTLVDNEFTFISEDYHEDYANVLKIVYAGDEFVINFIKNQNKGVDAPFRLGCNICFCNSGSRVPRIEQLFAIMFNELAYSLKSIEVIDNNL